MGREILQTQQMGAAGVGHHPGQRMVQVFGQQEIEMVGVKFVARGHGHQARRGAHPHRRR